MKFKTLIRTNGDDGYLALTEDGVMVGFILASDSGGLVATVIPVNIVVPPSEAPADPAAEASKS